MAEADELVSRDCDTVVVHELSREPELVTDGVGARMRVVVGDRVSVCFDEKDAVGVCDADNEWLSVRVAVSPSPDDEGDARSVREAVLDGDEETAGETDRLGVGPEAVALAEDAPEIDFVHDGVIVSVSVSESDLDCERLARSVVDEDSDMEADNDCELLLVTDAV